MSVQPFARCNTSRRSHTLRFGLPFICDPFAYGEQKTVRFTNEAPLKYAGTAETPVRITITNTGETDMEGIIIKVRKVIN